MKRYLISIITNLVHELPQELPGNSGNILLISTTAIELRLADPVSPKPLWCHNLVLAPHFEMILLVSFSLISIPGIEWPVKLVNSFLARDGH